MTGDRVPTNKSKALAYMMYNEVFKKRRKKLKRLLRRDKRRYLATESSPHGLDITELSVKQRQTFSLAGSLPLASPATFWRQNEAQTERT